MYSYKDNGSFFLLMKFLSNSSESIYLNFYDMWVGSRKCFETRHKVMNEG